MDFKEIKKIWIIGASSGIGAALAKKLAYEGKEVVVSARSEDKLTDVAKAHGNITAVRVDVTNPSSIGGAMGAIGDFDSVIMCAGTYDPETVAEFTAERFRKHFEINVLGTGNVLEPVLKYFREKGRGHIAITASVVGYHGLPKALSYGPTKAALNNLCESLAIELRETNISVQVINPGFVETPLTDQNDFDMPMIIKPEKAADYIYAGLMRGWYEITFPHTFSLVLKLVSILPKCISIPLIQKATKGKM